MLIAAVRGFSQPRILTATTRPSRTIMTAAQLTQDIAACGERLRQGHLVAFPTETVYGLGCHALDVDAVAKVFAAKERPLTDPLIVHVLEFTDAMELWQVPTDLERQILTRLCRDFWPGPLTLVAAANRSVVPDTIMAHTGYCACRSPAHPTARTLLQASQRPLAAPSANKFGHVSPTTAAHVWDDLQHEDVWILQDDDTPCDVGVESTVAKLAMAEDHRGVLTVLRQGAVSVEALRAAVGDLPVEVVAQLSRATADTVANVAPGQTIRHYSPNIPSFLVSSECMQGVCDDDLLTKAVVIDYGQQLAHWREKACAYRDLTPTGESATAAQNVFETLRWAEQVEEADYIVFPKPLSEDALALAVKDRLTRAASGVVIDSLAEVAIKR